MPFSVENPHLLPLLLVALLPILLHLLDRRRARVVEWPAVRFLVPRDRSRVRRLQRREALLIAVRSALALSIACALLRPTTTHEQVEAGASTTARAISIVIDNSYSMAHRESEEGPSGLERAKDAALTLLDDAAPASRVAVIAAISVGRPPAKSLGELDAARRGVRDAALGGGAFDLLQALDDACEPLLRAENLPRELFVFTDLQKSSLVGVEPDRFQFLRGRMSSGAGAVRARIVDCGSAKPLNRFAASLATEAIAAGLDGPIEVAGTVESSGGPLASDGLTLRLGEEGGAVETVEGTPGPDGRITARFTHRLAAPGDARLTFEAPPDLLREDDARHLVVEALERLPVLIVGDDVESSGPGSARYVDLALAPRAGGLSSPPLLFRPVFSREISPAALDEARVVIVTSLERIDEGTSALLEEFVRRGGGLLLFAGSSVDPVQASERLFRGGRGVLPGSLSPRTGLPPGSTAGQLHPRDIVTTHPALSVFTGAEEGDLTRVTIRAWTRLRETARDSGTLASVEPGAPWIVERKVGLGRAVLITTSASVDDSDLPLTPLFLPLLHRLTRYLAARDPAERALEVGRAIRWPLPRSFAGGDVSAVDPRGIRHAVDVVPQDGRKLAVFDRTALPGFYELAFAAASGQTSAFFAADVAADESRLERLDANAISVLERELGVEVTRDAGKGTGSAATKAVKREQWPLLLALAAGLFFVEQALSRSFAGARLRAPTAPGRTGT